MFRRYAIREGFEVFLQGSNDTMILKAHELLLRTAHEHGMRAKLSRLAGIPATTLRSHFREQETIATPTSTGRQSDLERVGKIVRAQAELGRLEEAAMPILWLDLCLTEAIAEQDGGNVERALADAFHHLSRAGRIRARDGSKEDFEECGLRALHQIREMLVAACRESEKK